MNSNIDVSKLLEALSKMDKKDLANGMNQLNKILSSNDKEKLINQLKDNMNK